MSAPDPAGRPHGPEHPYDPGLQPERTALAWRRTALALVVGSLLGLRALPPILGPVGIAVAGAGVAVALTVLALSHRRHRRVHRILTAAPPTAPTAPATAAAPPATPTAPTADPRVALPGGALPALVAALTACAGLAALILALGR